MDIIKAMFSTTKRAVISIIALLLVGALLGTSVAFAAAWMDARTDAFEHQVEQNYISSLQTPEESAPAADTAANNAPASEAPANNAPAAEAPAANAPAAETPASNKSNASNDPSANRAPDKTAEQHQKITAAQAEDIALKDAGIARSAADSIFSHYEMDDGFYQYEVQIIKDLYEYEYTISAETGDIFERDVDHIYD